MLQEYYKFDCLFACLSVRLFICLSVSMSLYLNENLEYKSLTIRA